MCAVILQYFAGGIEEEEDDEEEEENGVHPEEVPDPSIPEDVGDD